MIELSVPKDRADAVHDIMQVDPPLKAWTEREFDGRLVVQFVLDSDRTGPVVDRLEDRLGNDTDFRLIITSVEAVLPRISREAEAADAQEEEQSNSTGPTSGVSREELYNDVWDITVLSPVMVITAGLSSIVAAVGMMRDNVAVIIGAMVIAPLLGPNVGLALATTLADGKLLKRALFSNLVGSGTALVLAVLIGLIFDISLSSEELQTRLQVSLSDIVLALAAGAAGVLALTSGVAAALVGVMVAVALVPPLVAMGLMIGAGEWSYAGGAALLLAANIICVNLAGTLMFLAQGVRPLSWWEKDRARKMSWAAVGTWLTILAALVVAILLAGGPKNFDEIQPVQRSGEAPDVQRHSD